MTTRQFAFIVFGTLFAALIAAVILTAFAFHTH